MRTAMGLVAVCILAGCSARQASGGSSTGSASSITADSSSGSSGAGVSSGSTGSMSSGTSGSGSTSGSSGSNANSVGYRPGLWSLVPTANGFEWISPTGAPVCKYAGISKVDSTDLSSAGTDAAILSKYGGSWASWSVAQQARLLAWGFDAAGMYSYRYAQYPPDGGLPSVPTSGYSWYAMKDANPYHVKDAYDIVDPGGMICGSRIYQGLQMDPYDPGAQAALTALVAGDHPGGPNAMFYVVDEADDLFGFDKVSGHADLGYVVAANNPMVSVAPASLGSGYAYPDKTLYAKLGLRDFLAAKYGCAGSADPAAGDFCGASAASAALAALNAAWGTSYTTWNTSDPGGLDGIRTGGYASWGSGSGLLDENGAHLLSATQKADCGGTGGNGPSAADAWAATPAMLSDLHGYVADFAARYAREVQSAWQSACASAGCAPLFMPLYDGPSYAYAAMAPYVDGFWISVATATDPNTAEVSRILDAAQGKPVIVGDYLDADPDSPIGGTCSGDDLCSASQAARGQAMVANWKAELAVKNSQGKYAVVGLEHWSLYDSTSEHTDFGLVTVQDNPYDGSASTANGESADYGDALTPISAYLRAGICDP